VEEMRRVLSTLIAIIWSIILTGSNTVLVQNNSKSKDNSNLADQYTKPDNESGSGK
jgi:hypothetical protein